MDWQVARTWMPGVVHLQGVLLSGRGSQDLWYCAIRQCAFTVSLPQLLWRRADCRVLECSGVDFRLHGTARPPAEQARAGYPPIPSLLAPPAQIASSPAKSQWFVGVDRVALRDVRQIWIGGLRVSGPGEIHGSVHFVTQGSFEARLDAWRVPRAEVMISGGTVSSNADFNLSGKLGPLVFAQSPGERIFDSLDAALEIHGELVDLGRLTGRVDPSSSIVLGGTGTLNASLRVIRGVYWPGSSVEIHAPDMKVRTGDYSWRGKATLTDRIELDSDQRPRARLEMEETELELWYRDVRVTGARGPRLSLQSIAHDLRLVNRFADADLRMQISPMLLPDASALNSRLPQPMAKVFRSGAILLALEMSRTPSRGIEGSIDLTGDDLTAYVESKEYRVDARFRGRFAAPPSAKGRFDLSESSLFLTNIWAPRLSERRLAAWSAQVECVRGELHVSEPWSLQADVRLSMYDTRPILAALRSLPGTPGWLRWVPTIKNLNGQFNLGASKERLSLNQVELQGRATDFKAELEILDQKALGLVYLRYGLISLGLELLPERRDWHLLGAKRWYKFRTDSSNSPAR